VGGGVLIIYSSLGVTVFYKIIKYENKENIYYKTVKTILGGVLNPNSFGGFLTIFSFFVNNCK